jgi:peptidoglycan/xylan/chitin deacetylase (PgdA/CDA1 family)
VLALAAAAVGLALPPSFEAGELVRLQTRGHVVALTFDGGADAGGAQRVFATLRARRVPATFFVTGDWVRRYPALARAIGRNFAVGDHTVHHTVLPGLSTAAVRREIVVGARELRAATGLDPAPLFRFPYGARDARTLAIAHGLGYVSIRWTVDTWGWMGRSLQSPQGVVRRVVTHLQPGAIVLLHLGAARDGSTIDAQALPAVIAAVRARGYRFVTLAGVRPPR